MTSGYLKGDDALWLGLNYTLGSTSTDIADALNWSTGRVPTTGDSVRFELHGPDNSDEMGNLYINESHTTFNPNGDFILLGNEGHNGWRNVFFLYLDKSLTVSRFKLKTQSGSSSRVNWRFRLNTLEEGGTASLTLTGSGEALDMTQAEWQGIMTYGDIILTGDEITFSDTAVGGGVVAGVGDNSHPCDMIFSNPAASIYLGERAVGILPLGHMGLSVRNSQTWTAHENAFIDLTRNSTRNIIESPDEGRLDNLGALSLRVGHAQYGNGSTLHLRGGTYRSLYAPAGSSRSYRIILDDDVSFTGKYPGSDNGLRLRSTASGGNAARLDLDGHNLSILNGDLLLDGGGYINAAGSSIFVGGNIRNAGTNTSIGINGDADTTISLTGDFFHQGRSTGASGLFQSTVNAIGGGVEQLFEVGDAADKQDFGAASFAIGTLNIGHGETTALVKLVNEELNNNPVVEEDETDRENEKLLVRNLNINSGSTLNVNGQAVSVNSLAVAQNGWLDLNTGRMFQHGDAVDNFIGRGNLEREWNAFADRVKDSTQPSLRFQAAVNTPVIETPVGGKSQLLFDGVDDYIELPADGLGSGEIGAFTAELWLRVTSSPGNWGYALLRSRDANIGTGIYWLGVNGNDASKLYYGAAANGQHADGNTGVLIDNAWHHLALTYDGDVQSVYLDGELKASKAIGVITNSRSSNKIGIGSSAHTPSNRPIGGQVAEVRIWNYARSAADILASKDSQLSGSEEGLVGYWPLAEGYGTTVTDRSPSGNDGTMKNGLDWDGGEAFTVWQAFQARTLIIVQ